MTRTLREFRERRLRPLAEYFPASAGGLFQLASRFGCPAGDRIEPAETVVQRRVECDWLGQCSLKFLHGSRHVVPLE